MEKNKRKLILASESPRRLEILFDTGLFDISVIPSKIDESGVCGVPEQVAAALSRLKAEAVSRQYSGVVLAADTVVYCEGEILGKPSGREEAERMFRLLCGRTHVVVTGVTVTDGKRILTDFEKSYVTFADFCPDLVYDYIDSGKAYDKAGGYGEQDFYGTLITSVEGGRDNVRGLPLALTLQMLEGFYGDD